MVFGNMPDADLVKKLNALISAQDWATAADCADVLIERRLSNICLEQRENFDVACMLQWAVIQLAETTAKKVSAAIANLTAVGEGTHDDPIESVMVRADAEAVLRQVATENELAATRVVSANALVRFLDRSVVAEKKDGSVSEG